MQHPTPLRCARGFTLIELLVVLSIIAILIGVLTPALSIARQRARKTVCASNLRQVGILIETYKQDHGQHFPSARYMPEPLLSTDDDDSLPKVLDPYLRSSMGEGAPLYECPGDTELFELCGSSYMYQSELSGLRIDEFVPVKFMKVPVSQVLVGRDFDGGTFDLTDGQTITVGFFHDKRNLLFADGRVGNYE